VTVLIETILAAFEMEEILYELRDHIAGVERGSLGLHLQHHQKIQQQPKFHSARPRPDHHDRAVHARLHRTAGENLSHARGAHAIGGMAAFIPSRKDPQVNETALAKVRAKINSANQPTASTAPGWRIPTWCLSRRSLRSSAGRDNLIKKKELREDLQVKRRRTFSTSRSKTDRSPKRARDSTSTWLCNTWMRGCAVRARLPFIT
jgi:malate synthase